MTHAAATAACELSFSLSKLNKTKIRSSMMDQRFNNLIILKYYKNKLKEERYLMPIMNEFSGRNERRVSHLSAVVAENNLLYCAL